MSQTILTSDCPFFGVNAQGEATITVKQGADTIIAVINLGDAMDAAETLARLAIQHETNTRMGTSETRQARKLKAIRKAMGYTY